MSAPHIPSNNLNDELYSFFNEFRLQQKFHDVVIKVGGRLFFCHRVILASALKFFRSMFSGKFNETNEEEIELFDIDADDFELLLTYIYTKSVSFDKDNSYRLLKISHHLCLPGLENLCVKYMIDNTDEIPLDTVFDILTLSTIMKKNDLEEKVIPYVAKNFTCALKYPKFVHISGTHLLKILSHPVANRNSPETLDFLAKWMQFEPCEHKTKLLPDLLKTANLNQVPSEWFLRAINLMTNSVSLNICENVSGNIKEGLTDDSSKTAIVSRNFLLNVNKDQLCDDQNDNVKLPFVLYTLEKLFGSHVFNLRKFLVGDEVQFWKPMSQSGVLIPSSRKTKLDFCKSVLVDKIHYTLFMERTNNSSADHYCYFIWPYISRDFQLCKQLPSYSNKEYFPSEINLRSTIAANGTNIYVHNNYNFLIFNCQTNRWTEMLEDGLVKTDYPNLVSFNSSLYLVGGKCTSSRNYRSNREKFIESETTGRLFQHYDKREGKWTQMPRLKYSRSRSASCIHDGVLYVSGGDDLMYYKRYIECFDFNASKWRKLETSMPTPKLSHTLLAYNNQLWFFAGQKYSENSHRLQPDVSWYSYNIMENTWSNIFTISYDSEDRTLSRIFDVVNIEDFEK